MRYHLVVRTTLVAWLASEAAAQDRSAMCRAGHEHLTEAWRISLEVMQAPLAGIDTASQYATELPAEQQMSAMEVLEIIIEASLAGLEDRNGRFAETQAALAKTLYQLCEDDWPEEAPIPFEDPPAVLDRSE